LIVVGFVDHDIADDRTTKEIAGELSDLAARSQKQDLVLDLSGVVGVSSTILEKLLAIACAMEERGRDLRLCKVGPEVRRILAAKKLDHMFCIEEDKVHASSVLSRDRKGGNGATSQLFVSSQSSIPRPKPQVSPRVRAVARKNLIEPSAK
jgi:anti-anti-sigma factor